MIVSLGFEMKLFMLLNSVEAECSQRYRETKKLFISELCLLDYNL
jgi:hypothetical protein